MDKVLAKVTVTGYGDGKDGSYVFLKDGTYYVKPYTNFKSFWMRRADKLYWRTINEQLWTEFTPQSYMLEAINKAISDIKMEKIVLGIKRE